MRSVLLTVPRPPFFFFFNDTATTEIYTLSLHDALPISDQRHAARDVVESAAADASRLGRLGRNHAQADDVQDRKSTRLNSSHSQISYAVFCLKKKKKHKDKPQCAYTRCAAFTRRSWSSQ